MKTLTIRLSDETASRLEAMADQLGVSPEEIAETSLDEQLSRPEEDFKEALRRVLSKNAELYDRLA
jgi:predicted transcriptional regulator